MLVKPLSYLSMTSITALVFLMAAPSIEQRFAVNDVTACIQSDCGETQLG